MNLSHTICVLKSRVKKVILPVEEESLFKRMGICSFGLKRKESVSSEKKK